MGLFSFGEDEVEERDDSANIPLISHRKQGNQALRCVPELQRRFWANGVACALTAAFFFSWSNLSSKLVGAPAFQVLLLQGVGSLIVLLPLSAVFNWSSLVGKKEKLLQLVCASAVYGVFLSCQFISMFKIPISDTNTIRSLNSTIVAFFLWAINREPLGWPTVTGIATCIAGVVFTSLRANLSIIAAVATVMIGVFLYIRAVQLLFGAFAQALLSTGIFFVAVWEHLILGTPFTVLSGIGSLLMILGLFVVSFDSKPNESTQKPEDCVPPEEEV